LDAKADGWRDSLGCERGRWILEMISYFKALL
jgi:hypothetical protein